MNKIKKSHDEDQKFLNKIAFLESKQRESILPPEMLIDEMPIHENHTLLDIGAGSGFFTIPMAKKTKETVYALDFDSRMLNVISEKAIKEDLQNIKLIESTIEALSLEDESIDFIMASLILHEVESLSKVLSKLYEVTKIGGHLLCLEYEKDEKIIEGPPMDIRISSTDLEQSLLNSGFKSTKITRINDSIYTILAKK